MPTVGERLVHMGGYGDTFGAFQTEFGPMSGLICGENSNPLAVFALIAEGTRIHVMSWPNHFPTSGDPLRNRVAIDSQAFAQMSKAFVISACGTVDDHMIEMLQAGARGREIPARPELLRRHADRRSAGRIIAGPMGPEEGILYADCNLDLGIQMKLGTTSPATTTGRTFSRCTSTARRRSSIACTTRIRARRSKRMLRRS